MKANKVTVHIVTETLHIDCVPVLLGHVLRQLEQENISGSLTAEDGDTVVWNTTTEPIII